MNAEIDQPLYRFMDLFELYDLVTNNILKFTKLRLMEDKNEGLGEILKNQADWLGFPLRNFQDRLREAYDLERESCYISCWTPVADAMAMWLLYSKNHSSVRIKTSQSRLRGVLAANERDVYHNHYTLPPESLVPMRHGLGPVSYVNFNEVHKRSRAKLEEFDLKVSETYERGDSGKEEREVLLRSRDMAQIDELKHPGHLKDDAFRHENEVRAAFYLHIRNEMTLDEYRGLPNTTSKVLGNPMLERATRDNSPSIVNLLTPSNFVEEICFDSRMPHYQQIAIRRMLGRDDLSYVTTSVFGCLMDEHDLTIRERMYSPLGVMKGGLLS